jgi:hypothetical protein
MINSLGSFGYGLERVVLGPSSSRNELTVQLAYTVRLPFRLRFARITRFAVSESSYIAFHNPVPLRSPITWEQVREQFEDEHVLYTTVVAVEEKPKIDADVQKSITSGGACPDDHDVDHQVIPPALVAINRVIASHGKVAQIDLGSTSYPLVDGSAVEMKLLICAPKGHKITDEEIKRLAKEQRAILGNLSDWAPHVDVGDIQDAAEEKIHHFYSRSQSFLFDELAYASNHFSMSAMKPSSRCCWRLPH